MSELTLYHGFPKIIQTPLYGVGNRFNDYGLGFYCTQNEALACEWACSEQQGGYANCYSLECDGLNIVDLDEKPYTILHWLALLLKNRPIRAVWGAMAEGRDWLLANFLPEVSEADVLVGYRADDSYFSFARDFVGNTISLKQLKVAMHLGLLGRQVVLKTPKAFSALRYLSSKVAPNEVYFPLRQKRDAEARAAYFAMSKKLHSDEIYISKIISEEIKPDDPRLQ